MDNYDNALNLLKSGILKHDDFEYYFYTDYDASLIFVKNNGRNLEHVCSKFKKDRNIVLNSKNFYGALQYADKSLRDDALIVRSYFLNDVRSFQYASERLKNDKNFIDELSLINENIYKYIG